MRRLSIHKCIGNSLHGWHRVKNPLRVCANFLLVYSARYAPSLSLKRFLLRIAGAKVQGGAAFGLGAAVDIFFPENISVGKDAIIGYNTVLLGHEFLQGEYRTGMVEIGAAAMVGANCTVLPGVRIGEGATVSAMSLVNRDIPAWEAWGGIPAKRIGKSAGKGKMG
ncbi:MAG: DapH/DapD/GlmU-related protein [Candidatus Micrarchaeia archaeon]|jgi:acetyltransferase-like isoleucine patch superfamily enzyme